MLEPEGGELPPGRSQAAQAALSTAPCCHPSYVQFCPDFHRPQPSQELPAWVPAVPWAALPKLPKLPLPLLRNRAGSLNKLQTADLSCISSLRMFPVFRGLGWPRTARSRATNIWKAEPNGPGLFWLLGQWRPQDLAPEVFLFPALAQQQCPKHAVAGPGLTARSRMCLLLNEQLLLSKACAWH